MTVYSVHPVKDDTSSALVYGEIVHINTKYVFADELEDDKIPKSAYDRILQIVDGFDPSHDYLLIAGDHLQLIAVSAELAARWGTFKVLRFDRMAGGYVPVTIDTLEGMK